MTEQPQEKQYKQSEKKRAYFRERRRKMLLENKHCAICNEQAFARILITQEPRCAKHMVAPLKEEILKMAKPKEPTA